MYILLFKIFIINKESNIKTYQDYLTEKQVIFNELTIQIQLKNIIKYFEVLYINTKPNEKKLIERRALLFLLVFLTGTNLDILLTLNKFNLIDLLEFTNSVNKYHYYRTYVITQMEYDKKTNGNTTSDSSIYLVEIKKKLINNLLKVNSTNILNELKNLFIFTGDYYIRKTNTDYILSPLNNDKKSITKSNATKELEVILRELQLKNILNTKITFEDLFLNL